MSVFSVHPNIYVAHKYWISKNEIDLKTAPERIQTRGNTTDSRFFRSRPFARDRMCKLSPPSALSCPRTPNGAREDAQNPLIETTKDVFHSSGARRRRSGDRRKEWIRRCAARHAPTTPEDVVLALWNLLVVGAAPFAIFVQKWLAAEALGASGPRCRLSFGRR